jgi:hypothetical protein
MVTRDPRDRVIEAARALRDAAVFEDGRPVDMEAVDREAQAFIALDLALDALDGWVSVIVSEPPDAEAPDARP